VQNRKWTVEKIDSALLNKICDLFNVDFKYFLEDTVSQTNSENKNSAISFFGNSTVYNQMDENIVAAITKNQERITTLFEVQNKLIEKLLKM
jgi:hypothetical protein